MSKGKIGRHKSGRAHHPVVTERPKPHVHNWRIDCTCGWVGIPLRLKTTALQNFRAHAGHGAIRGGKKRADRRQQPARPRKVTPIDKLPPELR